MNLLHDLKPGTADEMTVVIEIPRGSKNKYEIDKETGLIKLDRPAQTAQDFPFDYGFIPQTHWDDGDAVDVIVLTTFPLYPGIIAPVRPIGLMNMIDDGDNDSKIIAVPVDDPRWKEVQDITDLPKHTLREMDHFYSTYKKLQDKEVSVEGFEGKEKAIEAFNKGIELYKQQYGK